MSIKTAVVTYQTFLDAFGEDPASVQKAIEQAADQAAGGNPAVKAQFIADWNQALSLLKDEDKGAGVLSTAQNAISSRLQSLLAQKALAQNHPAAAVMDQSVITDAGETFTPAVLEVKFDNEDLLGWLGMSWKLIFKPDKHAWIAPKETPEVLGNKATLAVFADWGTGLYGAPVIKASIEKMDPCDVALHLGDTYYSGSDDEITARLVNDFPRRPGTLNRSLNGNHEMYSGGQGYFQAIQGFFNQSASCFAMQNDNWLLVCLDTAYVDYDLSPDQVAWLQRLVNAAGARKLILFSHHQPFSQLDDQGPNLQKALGTLLQSKRIYAWYWGHEHRLVVYDPHRTWGFKGRCIGNGGFPAFRDDLQGIQKTDKYLWVKLSETPHAPAAQLLDGPNFWVTEDPMRYSPHGFLVLEFDGPNAFETYRLPDGVSASARMPL